MIFKRLSSGVFLFIVYSMIFVFSNGAVFSQDADVIEICFSGIHDSKSKVYHNLSDDDWKKILTCEANFHLLFHISNVKNSDLARLHGNPFVDSISLIDCPRLDEGLIDALVEIPNLRKIVLMNDTVANCDFKKLSRLKNLCALWIVDCDNLVSASFQTINQISTLTYLDISSNRLLDDVALIEISKLASLSTLNFSHCDKITDKGAGELEKLSALRTLDLTGCNKISVKSISKLSKLPLLFLAPPRNIWNDADVEVFANFKNIKFLYISQEASNDGMNDNSKESLPLSDVGLLKLSKALNLKFLVLADCPKITRSGLKEFDKVRPDCRVISLDLGYDSRNLTEK